jgi:hypothetical protein
MTTAIRRGLILTLGLLLCGVAGASDITPEGKKLGDFLDATNVEKLWIAKEVVDWKTGESLRLPMDDRSHTHCSAFVAAVCLRKDIYILRPPEHSAMLLASAQFDWLAKEGEAKGWKAVKDGPAAQEFANKGFLVVAVCKAAAENKSGHIAIVRPSTLDEKTIESEGPRIIQAGKTNYNSTNLKEGFKHHPEAWKEKGIRFYAHAVKWE